MDLINSGTSLSLSPGLYGRRSSLQQPSQVWRGPCWLVGVMHYLGSLVTKLDQFFCSGTTAFPVPLLRYAHQKWFIKSLGNRGAPETGPGSGLSGVKKANKMSLTFLQGPILGRFQTCVQLLQIRSERKKETKCVNMPSSRGPMERGFSIDIAGIDSESLVDQEANKASFLSAA
jgi:hypothetical protein